VLTFRNFKNKLQGIIVGRSRKQTDIAKRPTRRREHVNMMSMSMYRPRRSASVHRSTSVPLELSIRVVDSTKGGENSIPEDFVLSQEQLSDSIPYDDGGDGPTKQNEIENGEDERDGPAEMISRGVGQQHHRRAAINQLEEFFLGESSQAQTLAPVSVSNVPQTAMAKAKDLPKLNMFGQIMEGEPVTLESNRVPQHLQLASGPLPMNDSGYFWAVELDDDASSISTKESHQHFRKLTAMDRASSLPMECLKSPITSLNKKPSLKKISSIGQGMARKSVDGSFQRTVSFTSLSIREYPPSISDNPSCSFGPPVQLDWEYEAEATQLIDHYEESRQPRRANHELLLSYNDRRFLLLKQARYSRKEIKEAVKEAERVKRERMVTDLFLPAQALDETMENIMDSVKKFFGKK
jgi:hypothetical protein